MKNHCFKLLILLAAILVSLSTTAAADQPSGAGNSAAAQQASSVPDDFKSVAAADLHGYLSQTTIPGVVLHHCSSSPDGARLIELIETQGRIYAGLVQLVIVDDSSSTAQDNKSPFAESYTPGSAVPAKVVQFPCDSAAIDQLFSSVLQPPPSQGTPNNHCPL